MHIIHEEYYDRVAESKCFRRREISRRYYDQMISENDRKVWKVWKARATYDHTSIGYCTVRWNRREDDGRKLIDVWRFFEELPADFTEILGY